MLIAQLVCADQSIYADVVGYVRLKDSKNVSRPADEGAGDDDSDKFERRETMMKLIMERIAIWTQAAKTSLEL